MTFALLFTERELLGLLALTIICGIFALLAIVGDFLERRNKH